VELGRRFPSDEMLASIAKVLKIGLDELREHDQRAPLDEIRRITELDPKYAYAFRTLVEKQVSPEEIIKLASGKRTRRKDGPK
jgi:transcriptional regulator with XRE-family HTH domain